MKCGLKNSLFAGMMFLSCLFFSQNKKSDSLLKVLKSAKEDTVKIHDLNSLGWDLTNEGAYSQADSLARAALALAEKLNFKKSIGKSFSVIGISYDYLGDFPQALEYYFKSLKASEENNDRSGVLSAFSNIGNVYAEKGDYPEGLKYYLKALKLSEEMGNKKIAANNLNNIGVLYKNQGDFAKALEYYLKSLKIAEELGAKASIANRLGNIGAVYHYQLNYPKAFEYYFKALEIYETLENKNGIARNLCNVGLLYTDEGNAAKVAGNISLMNQKYNEALTYYFKALKIVKELGEKYTIAVNLGIISSVYISEKKYKDAYNYIYSALALSDSIGATDQVKSCFEILSGLYETSNISLPDTINGKILNMEQMRLRALYYHKKFISIRDTLFSQENKKQLVQKEMNFEFEKKETAAKAEQDKKNAIQEANAKKQKVVLMLVISGLIVVAVFAFFILRSLRVTRKQKIMIEHQKELVEEKQKEILDSIHYAKRIQTALITSEKYFSKNLTRLNS